MACQQLCCTGWSDTGEVSQASHACRTLQRDIICQQLPTYLMSKWGHNAGKVLYASPDGMHTMACFTSAAHPAAHLTYERHEVKVQQRCSSVGRILPN